MKNEEWGLKNVMNWPGEVIGHENLWISLGKPEDEPGRQEGSSKVYRKFTGAGYGFYQAKMMDLTGKTET